MNESVVEELEEIIVKYGKSIISEPRRLEALLNDKCGSHKREINVLLIAQKENVPSSLIGLNTSDSLDIWIPRLSQRLVDNWHLPENIALWAVISWAKALGFENVSAAKAISASKPSPVSGTTPVISQNKKTVRNYLLWVSAGLVLILILVAIQNNASGSQNSGPETSKLKIITDLPGTSPPSTNQSSSTIIMTSAIADKIAFSRWHNGNWQICIMNTDGSNQTILTNLPQGALSPAWSPEGNKITFISFVDSIYNIYVMNADGSNLIKLFHDGSDVDWSPDGQKLLFHSRRDGPWQIFVIDVNGRNLVKLTDNQTSDFSPLWSPDGKKIAFMSNRDGNDEIYLMNPDGSDQTRLTNNTSNDWLQDWSPDSKKLAYVSARDGNREIYIMDANGHNQTRLTFDPAEDKGAIWSPDGQKIGFTRAYENHRFEGFVMNSDGSNQNKIISDPIAIWSPDGNKIAFWSSVDGSEQIYLVDYDGENLIKLTNHEGGNRWPSWFSRNPINK